MGWTGIYWVNGKRKYNFADKGVPKLLRRAVNPGTREVGGGGGVFFWNWILSFGEESSW